MMYLFCGNDIGKSRTKCDMFLQKVFEKKPAISFFEFDAENYNTRNVEELLVGRGLFGHEHVVLLKEVFSVPEAEEFITERMEKFADSPNIFVFLEQKIEAPLLKKFTAHARKVWKLTDDTSAKSKFNLFALGDALGNRDRKNAWALFCRACDRENMAIEVIHGALFAHVKNMLLIKQEGKNPGLHPFVFQKTARFSKRYSEGELNDMLSALVALYHNARRGLCDMRVALELLILKI